MKNPLPALLLVVFFALGCGLGRIAGLRDSSNANTNANANANASPSPSLPAMADAQFAEAAFKSLTSGDPAAEWMVDWENFSVTGVDVGSQYRMMPGDTAKGAFRTAFIRNFSNEFKKTGASAADVGGWREESRAGDTTTVVGKVRNVKSIRLKVTHKDGRQGLAAIEID